MQPMALGGPVGYAVYALRHRPFEVHAHFAQSGIRLVLARAERLCDQRALQIAFP